MKNKVILCALCIATHTGYGSESTMTQSIRDYAVFGVADIPDFVTASKTIKAGGQLSQSMINSLKASMKNNLIGAGLVSAMMLQKEVKDHKNMRKACAGLLALDQINKGKKGEFRSRSVNARLSGGANNQVLTCTNHNDKTQRHVISMLDKEGIDNFNLGGYVFGQLCEAENERIKRGNQCDPSKQFCFVPERKCTFSYMPYEKETASEVLKGNKQVIGEKGENIMMLASTVAFTNPVTAAMAAAGAVFGLTARGTMQKKCKRQCTGYFLDQADKLGIKGKIDYRSDVKFAVAGSLKNRQCFCEYNGSIKNIPTHHMFNQRDERNNGQYMDVYKKNKKQSKKCKPEKKMCLIGV